LLFDATEFILLSSSLLSSSSSLDV
jgi:hypothetical protein